MHDRNIENRTRMKLQHEVQAMEQKLKNFELSKEQDRIIKSKFEIVNVYLSISCYKVSVG